jgi:hypothetical protein
VISADPCTGARNAGSSGADSPRGIDRGQFAGAPVLIRWSRHRGSWVLPANRLGSARLHCSGRRRRSGCVPLRFTLPNLRRATLRTAANWYRGVGQSAPLSGLRACRDMHVRALARNIRQGSPRPPAHAPGQHPSSDRPSAALRGGHLLPQGEKDRWREHRRQSPIALTPAILAASGRSGRLRRRCTAHPPGTSSPCSRPPPLPRRSWESRPPR